MVARLVSMSVLADQSGNISGGFRPVNLGRGGEQGV